MALDNSLYFFFRLSSPAEPKESRSERRRKRKELLENELDDESDISLSDDSSEENDSGSAQETLSFSYPLSGQSWPLAFY